MRGSISKRSAGSWTIQASGGFNDAGKRVRITRTVRGPQRVAERELTRLLHEIDTGTAVPTGNTPLGRYLVETWLPHAATRVRPTTLRRYEGLIRVHVLPTIGRVRLTKLRPLHVQSVLDRMQEGKASGASVIQCHRVLSAALRQAARWQILAVNPAAAVRQTRAARAQDPDVRRDAEAAGRSARDPMGDSAHGRRHNGPPPRGAAGVAVVGG